MELSLFERIAHHPRGQSMVHLNLDTAIANINRAQIALLGATSHAHRFADSIV